MVTNFLYAWKEKNVFKIKYHPVGKKPFIKKIKGHKIQKKLESLKAKNWEIYIKKPYSEI